MAKVPTNVKQKAEEADKLAQELFSEEKTEEEAAAETAEETQPAEETSETETTEEETTQEAAPAQQPYDDTWERRYRVLQGKYDAEIPRLIQENRDLKGKLDSKKPEESVEDRELETFKEDFPDIYNAMERMLSSKIPASISEKLNGLEQVTYKTLQDRLFEKLAENVPDWDKMNTDEGFLSWLGQKDRYSPYTRHQLLAAAFENSDADTVINFFKDYKDTATPAQTKEKPPKKDMGKYVAPTTSKKSGTIPTADEKQIFKKQEIESYYRDLALGKIIMTPEQKAAKEKEIWQAVHEGRVR